MFFIVAFRDENLFTQVNLELIASLSAKFEELPYVRGVTSLIDVEHLRGEGGRLIVEPLVRDLDGLEPEDLARIREKALAEPLPDRVPLEAEIVPSKAQGGRT